MSPLLADARGAPASATSAATRLHFVDGLRGIALIQMVVNHTSRDWLVVKRGWTLDLVYDSVIFPAAIFLFLVGFCLPISYHHHGAGRGFRADVRSYFRRGIVIVGAGYLLNAILRMPGEPLQESGVLHTIGVSIILLGPLVPALRWRWTHWVLPAVAVLIYLSFGWAQPLLARWSAAHPTLALIAFSDFPPWPWIAAPIIGLVLGWLWLEARARGTADEVRYFATLAVVGVPFLAAYAAWLWWVPTAVPFDFWRDFTLNRHWTPRGVTTFLIIGGVALTLAGCYWLMERRGWQAPWLVTLGQTAFMLYFVHQIIEEVILHRMFGVRFQSWLTYGIATVALIVLCVYLGRVWLAIQPWIRRVPLFR
jgi:uncharacterized membrane protein